MRMIVSPYKAHAPGTRQRVLMTVTTAQRSRRPLPFVGGDENASYGHLAELCAAQGMDLYVTHYSHLIGVDSTFAWIWQDGAWRPDDLALADVSLCYADLPENDPKTRPFRQALEVHAVPVVNALRLSDLLTDKLAIHAFYDGWVPSTWSAATPNLASQIREQVLHPDLSTDKLFLKPRYGERGQGIHVTNLDDLRRVSPALKQGDYILQAFLETSDGVPELGISGRHDLRLILQDGKIVLSFVRQPASGSYVSNCTQGGHEVPLEVERLPKRLRQFAVEVDVHLRCFGPRLYSLDIGFGRSGKIWIYELNTMPGIVWDSERPENKSLHLQMHRILADWLASSMSKMERLPEVLSEAVCA